MYATTPESSEPASEPATVVMAVVMTVAVAAAAAVASHQSSRRRPRVSGANAGWSRHCSQVGRSAGFRVSMWATSVFVVSPTDPQNCGWNSRTVSDV
jgi:hypothetical protein